MTNSFQQQTEVNGMAKFFESGFEHKHGVGMVMMAPAQNERITPEIFRQVHGGAPATQAEIAAANIRNVPNDFIVWRTKTGAFRAIKVSEL